MRYRVVTGRNGYYYIQKLVYKWWRFRSVWEYVGDSAGAYPYIKQSDAMEDIKFFEGGSKVVYETDEV